MAKYFILAHNQITMWGDNAYDASVVSWEKFLRLLRKWYDSGYYTTNGFNDFGQCAVYGNDKFLPTMEHSVRLASLLNQLVDPNNSTMGDAGNWDTFEQYINGTYDCWDVKPFYVALLGVIQDAAEEIATSWEERDCTLQYSLLKNPAQSLGNIDSPCQPLIGWNHLFSKPCLENAGLITTETPMLVSTDIELAPAFDPCIL